MGTSLLLVYGLKDGDWENFIQQWQSSRFIHVFPALLGDDMKRREMKKYPWYWVALIPLLGPLVYLCVRSPLSEADTSTTSNQQQPATN